MKMKGTHIIIIRILLFVLISLYAILVFGQSHYLSGRRPLNFYLLLLDGLKRIPVRK